MPVVVVTESQTCIPVSVAQELGVVVIPYILHLDDHSYRDGVEITAEEFYRLLPSLKEPARTSSISPGIFLETFRGLSGRADGILVVTIASTMSATHANARLAADSFNDIPVEVFDSGTAAMAQGLVVMEAAAAARSGLSLRECLEVARHAAEKVELYAYISTLEYLKKSGRVNAVKAFAADALSIKPVFRFKEGEAQLVSKRRSEEKARLFISRKVADHYRERGPLKVAVFHADARLQADELSSLIRQRVEVQGELLVTEFTPVMGCHTGPGVVGAAFL